MIVPEKNRLSKSHETSAGLLIAFIIIIFICVGTGLVFWLADIFHNGLVNLFVFFGILALSFVVADKIGKMFGVEFLKGLTSGDTY